MADKVPEDVAANAPDPEEDDLDDLDDVLDSFQAKPAAAPTPATAAPTSSGPGRPAAAQDVGAAPAGAEDFTKQIQESMANLMSELDSNPDMQAEFEKMMSELISAEGGAGGAGGLAGLAGLAGPAGAQPPPSLPKAAPSAATPSTSAGGKKEEADFQSKILKTMERINASDSTATASTAAAPSSEEDLLAAMMKELGGGGEGGDGDFNSMLMNMMAHLTNKEILYEPMKELHDKFPAWMEKNAATQKAEDLERYKTQQTLVGEIVGRFERKGYKDENEDDREYIVERMQKVRYSTSLPLIDIGTNSMLPDASGRKSAFRFSGRHECRAGSSRRFGPRMSDAIGWLMGNLKGSDTLFESFVCVVHVCHRIPPARSKTEQMESITMKCPRGVQESQSL